MVNSGKAGAYDGFSIVEGHEFAESVTDPLLTAWRDPADDFGGEIGDKCAWQGVAAGTFSTGSFAVQPLWSNSLYAQIGRDGAQACVLPTPAGTHVLTVVSFNGTVTSSPAGVNCSAICFVTLSQSTITTLTETPAAGSAFLGWSETSKQGNLDTGGCQVYGLTQNTCTVAMAADHGVAPIFEPGVLYQQGSATYTGTWHSSSCQCYSGGTDEYSTQAGATATFHFTGDDVCLFGPVSAARGSYDVYIDGTLRDTDTEYSVAAQNSNFLVGFDLTAGKHTLKIVNMATRGHPRVDVDALFASASDSPC
jgi:hypothetical protein